MVFARLSMSSLVQCKRPNETHAVSRRLRARDLLKTMRAVHGNGNSHSDSGRYGIVKGRPAATATVPQRATPTPRPRPTRPPTPAVLYVASGTFGVQGILYTLDPATGAVFTTVGPLNDAAGNNYGITGLKYHPFTGIFYGVTRDPTNPDYLVLVNPATALVTPIGPLGAILTDMAINPTTGFMYAVSGVNQKFYTINTAIGQAVQTGLTGIGFQNGGGLAVDGTGALSASITFPSTATTKRLACDANWSNGSSKFGTSGGLQSEQWALRAGRGRRDRQQPPSVDRHVGYYHRHGYQGGANPRPRSRCARLYSTVTR